MKLTSSFLTLALALPAVLAVAQTDTDADASARILPFLPKPLVQSSLLQLLLTERGLMNHAKQFAKFASQSGGTRAFGTPGHNATVAYIKRQLDYTGYYDTEIQTFPYLFSQGTSTFAANGTTIESAWFTYGPATDGPLTKPLVPVDNLGCTAVSS